MRERDDMRVIIYLSVDVDRGSFQLVEEHEYRSPDSGDWERTHALVRPMASAAGLTAGVMNSATDAVSMLLEHLRDHDELTLPFD